MSNSIKYVTKVVILIVYILIIFFILHHHCVEAGECAARVYYIPLGRWDYILISLIGIIMLFLSRYIITTSKKFRALEILILLLSAKTESSESNFLKGRSWAYF